MEDGPRSLHLPFDAETGTRIDSLDPETLRVDSDFEIMWFNSLRPQEQIVIGRTAKSSACRGLDIKAPATPLSDYRRTMKVNRLQEVEHREQKNQDGVITDNQKVHPLQNLLALENFAQLPPPYVIQNQARHYGQCQKQIEFRQSMDVSGKPADSVCEHYQ
jgi:hypothetical protein